MKYYYYFKDNALYVLLEERPEWEEFELTEEEYYAKVEQQKQKRAPNPLFQEYAEIQKWFLANDWKINKIVIGEWTREDPRWIDYLEERQKKRDRQDEIVNSMEGDQ